MRNIRTVTGRIRPIQLCRLVVRNHHHSPLLYREEFASPLEVRSRTQGSARIQQHLVELHILLQMQWRQCSDRAVLVGTKNVAAIVGPDNFNTRCRSRLLHQLRHAHSQSTGNLDCDRQRRIGLLTLDLAEHRAADTGRPRQHIQ